MLKKMVCAMFVMVVSVAFVGAEEFFGAITKVEDGKITVQKMTKGKKGQKSEKDGDPISLKTTSDTKVVKGKFSAEDKKFVAGDAVEGGLKSKMFTDIPEAGVIARITATDGTATEILLMGKGGKKKKE